MRPARNRTGPDSGAFRDRSAACCQSAARSARAILRHCRERGEENRGGRNGLAGLGPSLRRKPQLKPFEKTFDTQLQGRMGPGRRAYSRSEKTKRRGDFSAPRFFFLSPFPARLAIGVGGRVLSVASAARGFTALATGDSRFLACELVCSSFLVR